MHSITTNMNFSTNISLLWILLYKCFSILIRNSQKFFNHFQKQPPEMFHKKHCFQTFWDSHRKSLCVGVSFLIKVQPIRPVTFLKRDSNTDIFLWISGNTYFEEHFRTAAFLQRVLREHFSDQDLSKGTFDETKIFTCCMKGCSISQDWTSIVCFL